MASGHPPCAGRHRWSWLAAHLGSEPAGQDRDMRQGETEKDAPQQRAVTLYAVFDAQICANPGEKQHDQAAPDHDAEGEERGEHWWPILRRKIGQADFLGVE